MNDSKNFFSNFFNVEEIKNHYRALCRKYHPDLGGDTATMQEINAQYKKALENCDGQESTDSQTGATHTYKYNETTEQAIIDKLAELFAAGMPEGVRIYIIGLWLWIMGTERTDKDTQAKLKAAGCKWHSKRVCWYYRPYKAKHRGRGSNYDLDTLAQRYGCSEAKQQTQKRRMSKFSLSA